MKLISETQDEATHDGIGNNHEFHSTFLLVMTYFQAMSITGGCHNIPTKLILKSLSLDQRHVFTVNSNNTDQL